MQNELEKQVIFLVYSTPEQDIKVNAVLKDESIFNCFHFGNSSKRRHAKCKACSGIL